MVYNPRGGCTPHLEECSCDCHHTGAMHCIPCCGTCEKCGKNVRIGAEETHAARCSGVKTSTLWDEVVREAQQNGEYDEEKK